MNNGFELCAAGVNKHEILSLLLLSTYTPMVVYGLQKNTSDLIIPSTCQKCFECLRKNTHRNKKVIMNSFDLYNSFRASYSYNFGVEMLLKVTQNARGETTIVLDISCELR